LPSPMAGTPPARAGDLDLVLDVALKDGGKRLDLRNLEAGSGKSRLSADGSLDLGEEGHRLEAKVRPSQVMMGDLAPLAALLGAKFPPGLTSAAPIAFQGEATGPLDHPDQMKYAGEISLSGVRYADPSLGKPIEDIAGKLTFESGGFKISGFSARVGKTRLDGGVSVREFTSPQIALELHSPSASLDELMSLLTPASAGSGGAGTTQASGGDILGRTRGTGTVRIDEGSFGTFRFSRFTGNLALAGKEVTFDPVSFQLYGGTYQGSLSADLRGAQPRYAYRSSVRNVNAEPFLAENLGVKDLLAGSVSADMEMTGSGSEMNSILSSLNGHGTIKVEKGWIGRLDIMGGLAKASSLLGEKTLAQLSTGMAKNRTEFSSLTGDIALADGRATSNNLKLVSKDLDLEGKGGFTLQGILDLDLKVLLSQEITRTMLQEGSRARYLGQEGGRIVLPLTIKGPLASPTYGVNVGDITRNAATSEALQRLAGSNSALGQLAGSLLGGKKPQPQSPPASPPPGAASGSKSPAGASPSSSAASPDAAILITSHDFEGGLLFPDLTLRGEFKGVGLAGADIKVTGHGDQAIWEKANAFKEIAAYYAAHDPKAPARIPFKLKIDGKRLAGAGDLKITVTLHRSDGTTSVQTINQPKTGL
jgi:AsmA-like protein